MKTTQLLLSAGILFFSVAGFSAEDNFGWVGYNAKLAAQSELLKERMISAADLQSFTVTSSPTEAPSEKELRYDVSFVRQAPSESAGTANITVTVTCKLRRVQMTRYGFGTATDCKVESVTDNGSGN